MSRFFLILGALLVALAIVGIAKADTATLAAIGVCLLVSLGFGGFGLCVLSGQISREERDEANGLKHPDNLEGKN